MKVKVDEELCVGCGPCADICPEIFEIENDLAKVKAEDVPADLEEKCKQAAENCPSEAIKIEE
jgi:ferredoxin